ncbi:MAG: hypothetical protein KF797_15000 [Flavobacteriales bacterium]|nr:hypothetical protein [Flavobacteriales bacterium]
MREGQQRQPVRKAAKAVTAKRPASLYKRVQGILEQARDTAARSVNTAQVVANWLIGREIVEDEQSGARKADYGKRVLQELSGRLQRKYGNGYSVDNLELFRRFFLNYPSLLGNEISDAVRRKSSGAPDHEGGTTHHAVRDGSGDMRSTRPLQDPLLRNPVVLRPVRVFVFSIPCPIGSGR